MGTKVAPTYATLTIGYLELKLYKEIADTFGTEYGVEFKRVWKRFLDDCFVPWTKSQSDLNHLQVILNNLHKDIKFILDYSKRELPFLDCLLIKEGTTIETDIFYKPTDSKTYLLFNSCHPKHTKVSIPFSLSRRLKTIISKPEIFEKCAAELEHYLKKQNYPVPLIKAGIDKARLLDRNILLEEVNNTNNTETIPYVSTYNPQNPEIYPQLLNDINVLKRDTHMRDVLDKFTFIKSKRQPPNLKRLLTKAKFCENENTPTVTRCGRPNCALCTHLIEGEKFISKQGIHLNVKFNMSCDVKNVVYVIVCKGCQNEYVGETNDLRKRMSVHRNHIRDPSRRLLKVSGHIDECINMEPKFLVFPIYKMQTDSVAARRQKEKIFIRLLKPLLN